MSFFSCSRDVLTELTPLLETAAYAPAGMFATAPWLETRSREVTDEPPPAPPYDDRWMTTVRALTVGRYVGASSIVDVRVSVLTLVVVRCAEDSMIFVHSLRRYKPTEPNQRVTVGTIEEASTHESAMTQASNVL